MIEGVFKVDEIGTVGLIAEKLAGVAECALPV